MIALLGGCALRVGQLVSLLREDMHFVPPGRTAPGCSYTLGPQLHLRKRDGHPRGAANKNRGTVVLPVPSPVEMLYADWMRERLGIRRAGDSPWAIDVARDVLQPLLGHSDVNSQDTYRNVSDGKVVQAAQTVTDKLFGSP